MNFSLRYTIKITQLTQLRKESKRSPLNLFSALKKWNQEINESQWYEISTVIFFLYQIS